MLTNFLRINKYKVNSENSRFSFQGYIDIIKPKILSYLRQFECKVCCKLLIKKLYPPGYYEDHHSCEFLLDEDIQSINIESNQTNNQKIEKWGRRLLGIYQLPQIYLFFYQKVPLTYIDVFLTLTSIFGKVFISEKQILKKWRNGLLKLYLHNPNMTTKEILDAINSISINRWINYSDFLPDNTEYKDFAKYIRKLNDDKMSELWNLWELEPSWVEYFNYSQWLPEELIVDISELEKKSGKRFGYSTYKE